MSSRVLRALTLSYSQVFFSTKPSTGFLFLLGVMVTTPEQGIVSMAAIAMAALWAYTLNLPKQNITSGYYGFNALLSALAFGAFYKINFAFILLLMLAMLFCVLVCELLQALFRDYLFLPVLSLPFVVTSWLVLAASRHFSALVPTTPTMPFLPSFIFLPLMDILPTSVELFLKSAGAALFQANIISGTFIAIGLLLYSRLAFLLALLGVLCGTVVYSLLQGNPAYIYSGYVGFNCIFTAIAIGGVWLTPSIRSFSLAMLAAAMCAVIAAACASFFNLVDIPPLALPFLLSTYLTIFAAKRAGIHGKVYPLAPAETPEKALKTSLNASRRFVSEPSFLLPFSGEWTVTQGLEGRHTHKDIWKYAWDFEVVDKEQRKFHGDGLRCKDYYAYNLPVYAPAAGTVVKVVNHIPDSQLGQIDAENNWGNFIIIWHYGYVYSALCHLREGSITVAEGELVHCGQVLGRVGNSGRAIVPHLHFQIQNAAYIGAPTISCQLLHFIERRGGRDVYSTYGVPKENDTISALVASAEMFNAVCFPLGKSWKYEVRSPKAAWQETWRTEVDFWGNCSLVCEENSARLYYLVNQHLLLFLHYEGKPNTGLYWLFMGLPRLPLTTQKVVWFDKLPSEMMLSFPLRAIPCIAELLCNLFPLTTQSCFADTSAFFFSVETVAYKRNLHNWLSPKSEVARVTTDFTRNGSIGSLTVVKKNKKIFAMRPIKNE